MTNSGGRPWVRPLLLGLLVLGGCRNSAAAAGQSTQPNGLRSVVLSARAYTKPADDVLRRNLTPAQYEVTQNESTEPPFRNAYWNNHSAGLYVDVATGEPLFSSTDKFDSGTGWPSFTRPVEPARVIERQDRSFGSVRTEVRSRGGSSHLGHVFDDGPAPTGLRYCINSAAIRLVPVDKLEAEGYGAYRVLFQGTADSAKASDKAGDKKSATAGQAPRH